MPRFVILEHDWPVLHWDLMLEVEDRLRTWRLAEPPNRIRAVPAQPIGDHRLEYLDYEGPVSRDRGRVVRLDAGEYAGLPGEDYPIILDMNGRQLQGRLCLRINDNRIECLMLEPSSAPIPKCNH